MPLVVLLAHAATVASSGAQLRRHRVYIDIRRSAVQPERWQTDDAFGLLAVGLWDRSGNRYPADYTACMPTADVTHVGCGTYVA
jgi:hypothetical protein